jgi:hypothetical protein
LYKYLFTLAFIGCAEGSNLKYDDLVELLVELVVKFPRKFEELLVEFPV